jgi:hypothetical protein
MHSTDTIPVPTTCRDCRDGLLHCHEISLEHADGSTECLGLGACEVDHTLHAWQLPCSALEPPCPCAPDEQVPPAALTELVAA